MCWGERENSSASTDKILHRVPTFDGHEKLIKKHKALRQGYAENKKKCVLKQSRIYHQNSSVDVGRS